LFVILYIYIYSITFKGKSLEEFKQEDRCKLRSFSTRCCLELSHILQKKLFACYVKRKSERKLNIRYEAFSSSASLPFIQQYSFPSLSLSFSQQTLSPPFTVYFNHAYINVKSFNLDSGCRKVVSDPIKVFRMMSNVAVLLFPLSTEPHPSHSTTTIAFRIFCPS
jgi:hypothetical protein